MSSCPATSTAPWTTAFTKEELVEVITHATFYSGWPTGVQGAAIAKKVFESRGL